MTSDFERELSALINRHNKEAGSSTPDWILAKYLNSCLSNYNETVSAAADWWGDASDEDFEVTTGA